MKLKFKFFLAFISIFIFSSCSLLQIKPLKNAIGNTKEMKKDEILNYDKIYEGIFVNDIDLKDLTKEEAIEKIKKSIQLKNFLLSYKNYKKDINLSDIDFKLNYIKVVDEAFSLGRSGTDNDRISFLKNLLINPKKLTVNYSLNYEKLNKIIEKIEKDINKDVVDDKLIFTNKAEVKKGTDGVKLDKEKLIEKFKNFNYNFEIDIPVDIIEHKKTDETLVSSIKGVIGEAISYYNFNDPNRITNLSIAAEKLNNVIIMPGEVFSFVKYVNNVTKENGYKPASTFLGDRDVLGIGGGVCQISSTLYDSALRADMEIIERNQHSLRVHYVPFALDAMFYEGSSDLKFKNNFDFPIVILSKVSGGAVTFKILGDTSKKNYDVKIYSKNIITIPMPIEKIEDDTLEEGKVEIIQKGFNGYKGNSYIKRGNSKEKLLNSDYYRPKKQIIKVGTKTQENEEDDNDE